MFERELDSPSCRGRADGRRMTRTAPLTGERARTLAVAVLLLCVSAPSPAADERIALTKTRSQTEGSSGVRLTGLWVFDHIGRFDNAPDKSGVDRFGLFTGVEFPSGLPEADAAGTTAGRVRSRQVSSGIGWTEHFAGNNYSMHAIFSRYFDPMRNRYDSGSMLGLGYSTEVGLRRDILYANGYWAEGVSRRPASDGLPSGPVGLSFSGVGPWGHRPARWPRPLDSAGFAVGMQAFMADEAANWAVELGHRQDLGKEQPMSGSTSATALTTRFQHTFTEHFLLQFDAYYALHGRDPMGRQDTEDDGDSSALRVELRVTF